MFPQPYDPAKHYPMIVLVHGGPAADFRPWWPRPGLPVQLFSEQGYFLLFPEFTWELWAGRRYTRGNIRDFGHGDLSDILTGVDHVVKNYPVDRSSGGYCWLELRRLYDHVGRYADEPVSGGVRGRGDCELQSYYGQNSIDQWMLPYFCVGL